jgi:hypothetical protein
MIASPKLGVGQIARALGGARRSGRVAGNGYPPDYL